LTGGIKESNTAAYLGRMDINAVAIEGAPANNDLYLLCIDANREGALESANDLLLFI
jgi:hypothetical protein